MYNKCLILVSLAMAVAVTATMLPKTESTVVYDGNDFSIGERVDSDYQLTQYGVWGYANGDEVITKSLVINTIYEITYISGFDKTVDQSTKVGVTLVSGGPGSKKATIEFTSSSGKDFVYWVDVYVRR